MKKSPQQKANLRVCASCEWVFEFKNHKDCPKCGFASYGAHYVYGDKAYQYKHTQEPWKQNKLINYDFELDMEIQATNDNTPKKKNRMPIFSLIRKEIE